MITAVDTNVLLDIFGVEPTFYTRSAESMRRCQREGSVIACEVVWAEAAAAFADAERFQHAMNTLPAAFSAMTNEAAIAAGQAWRRYRAGGGPRIRIAADFMIGAHAAMCADRLLTRDRGFFRRYFSGLRIVDPTAPNAS